MRLNILIEPSTSRRQASRPCNGKHIVHPPCTYTPDASRVCRQRLTLYCTKYSHLKRPGKFNIFASIVHACLRHTPFRTQHHRLCARNQPEEARRPPWDKFSQRCVPEWPPEKDKTLQTILHYTCTTFQAPCFVRRGVNHALRCSCLGERWREITAPGISPISLRNAARGDQTKAKRDRPSARFIRARDATIADERKENPSC